jgi:hypothetical protein
MNDFNINFNFIFIEFLIAFFCSLRILIKSKNNKKTKYNMNKLHLQLLELINTFD